MNSVRDDIASIKQSHMFDKGIYGAFCRRDFVSDEEAILHFLRHMKRPDAVFGRQFSPQDYLAGNSDVEGDPAASLRHFLHQGLALGRRRASHPGDIRRPKYVDLDNFKGVRPRKEASTITVVIPVFSGRSYTLNAILGLLHSINKSEFQIHVVNDCSNDVGLAQDLRFLARQDLFLYSENAANLGFVRTVNKAIAMSSSDIILFNSDAVAYDRVIDVLIGPITDDPAVASVTPFSNNATICSYPLFAADNNECLEFDDIVMNDLCWDAMATVTRDIPVGVGFCMSMSRRAIDEIGNLDDAVFGRGYGEEVDWCLRAREIGYRHVIACGAFVTHYGGASFGHHAKSRGERLAGDAIERLHPGYEKSIATFVAEDSLASVREILDRSRLERRLSGGQMQKDNRSSAPAVTLIFCDVIGGGTEKHIVELEGMISRSGRMSLRCLPTDAGRSIEVRANSRISYPNIDVFDMRAGVDRFSEFCTMFNVEAIHVHHLIGFQHSIIMDFLVQIKELQDNLSLYMSVHDYLAICPRITLTDKSEVYCGEPDISICEKCVSSGVKSRVGRPVVWRWRQDYQHFLDRCDAVFVPNVDVKIRLSRYFAPKNIYVRPHQDTPPPRQTVPSPIGALQMANVARSGKTTIVIPGAIGPAKGSCLMRELAKKLLLIAPDIALVFIGYTDIDYELVALPNVTISGHYDESDFPFLIEASHPSLIFLSSVWPETYSFVLSLASKSSAPIAYFGFGAIADRLRGTGDILIPLSCLFDHEALAHHLVAGARQKRKLSPERVAIAEGGDFESYYAHA